MFKTSEKVVCVDDKNPNPNSSYPCGYVVKGSIYCVCGIGYEGGIQIVGKPVIGKRSGLDAGWLPHRFRRLNNVDGSSEPALANEAVVLQLKP